MRLIEVNSEKDDRKFWEVSKHIYRDDSHWYPPLDIEMKSLFHIQKNPLFKQGAKAKRWYIEADGQPIARIAAFINPSYQKTYKIDVGGIGFFEAPNDQTIANKLFEVAEDWLRENGQIAVDGPINFGERNRWWGLLVDGFYLPTYGMAYNKPYYQKLWENAGYQELYKQFTYVRPVHDKFHPRVLTAAEKFHSDPNFSFEHFSWKNLDRYINALIHIYTKAWGSRPDARKLTYEEVKAELSHYKFLIDERLLWFAFHKDEPAAFFIMFRDITPIVQKLNGKLNLINKLRFWWQLKFNPPRRMLAILYGVIPEFKATGLLLALVYAAAQVIVPSGDYDELEMYWIGSFHPVMHRVVKFFDAQHTRTHITYRKMLKEGLGFIPHPTFN